jgi:hypothetical protein
MNHAIAGALVGAVFFSVVILWILLGLLVGPEWAIIILLSTVGVGVAAGIADYASERR